MTIRASELLGAAVIDRRGRRLGRIDDLLLLDEPLPTTVCYALVELEQVRGQDTRTVAVPWSVLEPDRGDRQLVLDASRDSLGRLKRYCES